MPSSVMLRGVVLLRTDVFEGLSASIITMARIGEMRTSDVIFFGAWVGC
jgi:hypothetical protein